ARSVPDFQTKVAAWEAREIARLQKMLAKETTEHRKKTVQMKMADIGEKATMLLEITEGAKGIAQIEERIFDLFKDDGVGVTGMITCSSIHKAKGLEANRVFILEE